MEYGKDLAEAKKALVVKKLQNAKQPNQLLNNESQCSDRSR